MPNLHCYARCDGTSEVIEDMLFCEISPKRTTGEDISDKSIFL